MASSSSIHLLLLLFFSFLTLFSIQATARPGVHFLSISYTISSSSKSSDPSLHNPSSFFAIYREFHDFQPRPFHPSSQFYLDRPNFPQISSSSSYDSPRDARVARPVPFVGSFGSASLRERTQDILSIVFALLFGASCGMLTAATIYLVWSVITNRGDSQEAFDDGEDSDEDGVKDMEYAKIPASPKKEGYVGN